MVSVELDFAPILPHLGARFLFMRITEERLFALTFS
jgi:hypothetical protein